MKKKWLLWLAILGFILVLALVPIWAFPNLEEQLTKESQNLESFQQWQICEIEFHGRNGYLTVPSNMDQALAETLAASIDDIQGVRDVEIAYTGAPIETEVHDNIEVDTSDKDIQAAQEEINDILVNHTIEFESGTAELTDASKTAVSDIAMILKNYPNANINIIGHTDATGDSDANMILSLQRAEAVVSELVSQGIESNRLTADGKGDTEPIASNDTEEGRKQNRRVEIIGLEN